MVKKRTTRFLLISLVVIIFLTPLVKAEEPVLEIVINIPQFKLYLYENQILIRQYPIGVGNEIRPSVLGKTEVINRVVNPTYYPPRWWEKGIEPIPPGPDNPVGTRWIGLGFPSYGIHGTNNPGSIGKAMSAGCIRMYNADVEELMDLVPIGTPVSLIYQTIIVNQDPLINTKTITILPDIYNNSSNSLDNVKQILAQRHWTDVYLPVLEFMMDNAVGMIMPLPIAMDIKINDQLMDQKAVKYGKKYYIPLNQWEDIATSNRSYRDFKLWDGKYVNLIEFANTHGCGFNIGDEIELFDVEVVLFDNPIGVNGFLLDNQLYLSVDELSSEVGLPIPDFPNELIRKIAGNSYLDQSGIEAWGFTIDWEYPLRQAKLQIPQAYLDQELLGIALTKVNRDIYVPLNPVLDLIKAKPDFSNDENTLFFNDTHGVEMLKVNDLVYVPEWVIRWLMPGAELSIVYP